MAHERRQGAVRGGRGLGPRDLRPHEGAKVQDGHGEVHGDEVEHLGFSSGTLERRYSRIILSPPQKMKPDLGHEG